MKEIDIEKLENVTGGKVSPVINDPYTDTCGRFGSKEFGTDETPQVCINCLYFSENEDGSFYCSPLEQRFVN